MSIEIAIGIIEYTKKQKIKKWNDNDELTNNPNPFLPFSAMLSLLDILMFHFRSFMFEHIYYFWLKFETLCVTRFSSNV